MAVNTRGGKHTINTPMSSVVVGDMRMNDDVVEASRGLGDVTTQVAELS